MVWGIDAGEVDFSDGVFSSKSDPELRLGFKELAQRLEGTGGPVTSTASVDLAEAGNSFAVHICDLEVDPQTGKTDVIRYTALQDVGKAVHPSYVEGQLQGGVVQGIGWTLNEEYFMTEFGVRGVAEVPLAPPLGAVSNAVTDATGQRYTDAPINPGKIVAGLANGDGS